ncbi:MAG: extracellular solute-binding protein, partial [Acidimicrobiales bacterium]|nr:extracellular solute-binding protein [Acidimicrobiales bacterium]
GIVYATDVIALPEIEGIALPANTDVAITYPIAVLTDSPNPDLARTFFDFVLSAPGQALLADAGFIAP